MENDRSYAKSVNILARLFAKKLNEKINGTGLTASQWGVINHLRQHGELTQTELCEQLSIEAPTASRTLCYLEAAGWISRLAGHDKREKKVGLTAKAGESVPACLEATRCLQKRAVAGITPEDLLVFDRVMAKITANLQKDQQ